MIECWSSSHSTRDVALDLTLGDAPSISKPLGVKIMKDRIVRVKPFLIIRRSVIPDPDHPGRHLIQTNPPDLYPTPSELQIYLNGVFRPQLNTTILVAEPTELQLEWDANGNGSADPESLTIPGPELQPILDLAAGYVVDADIQIFFLGADKLISDGLARGLANRGANACWVVAESFENPAAPGSGVTLYEVMQSTAHEVGHLLVGLGHPDARVENDRGPAQLLGTDYSKRLMVSGDGLPFIKSAGVTRSAYREHRLVKGEWDKAEEWLKGNIDDPNDP